MGQMLSPSISSLPTSYNHFTQFLLSGFVLFWGGHSFLKKGIQSFRARKLNMFSLITIGTLAAYLISTASILPLNFIDTKNTHLYFESTCAIISLVLLGQMLESRAYKKTTSALTSLIKESPQKAIRINKSQEEEIDIAAVQVGDLLRIKPGSKIPVDGVVIDGSSHIDESMINGEPLPVEKGPRSVLYAGTINQNGSLVMQARKVGKDTLLAQIIQSVEEAQATKLPIEKLVDKISAVFIPTIISTSIITLIIWSLLGDFQNGFSNAISVLIISCPCALGLATPMAITVAIGRASKEGIFIKEAQALETLAKTSIIAFDKTGTLTIGKPTLTDIAADSTEEDTLLQLAASIEKHSEHPLAQAICTAAHKKNIPLLPILNFKSLTGQAVTAKIEKNSYLLGKKTFIEDSGIPIPITLAEKEIKLNASQKTTFYLSGNKEVKGLLGVSDPIKPSAKDTIKELKKLKIKAVILTGDNGKTTQSIAQQLKIEEYHASLLPTEKLSFIKKSQENGTIVTMVGDGINDAPALTQANIGIAMAQGTHIAIKSADITLLNKNLNTIPKAFKLSSATLSNIKQNLFFAFLYNTLSIPIAAGALQSFAGISLNPAIASMAMSLSSLCVVANALRLKEIKL